MTFVSIILLLFRSFLLSIISSSINFSSLWCCCYVDFHFKYTLTVQHYSYLPAPIASTHWQYYTIPIYQLPLRVHIDSTILFLFPDCRLPLYRLHQSTKSKLKCVFEFQNGVGVLACTLYNIQIIINCNGIKN